MLDWIKAKLQLDNQKSCCNSANMVRVLECDEQLETISSSDFLFGNIVFMKLAVGRGYSLFKSQNFQKTGHSFIVIDAD